MQTSEDNQPPITWQDCLNAQDELIETIKLKMQQEPENGDFWQDKLAIEMLRRQEVQIMVERDKKLQEVWDDNQQFMQSLQKICDNVLERSKGQNT